MLQNKIATCLLGTVLLLGHASWAQAELFSPFVFEGKRGDSLGCRLLIPDANTMRKLPLVIFLHGSGERGSDNKAQLKWGVQSFATTQQMKLNPAIVVAPQCPAGQSWSNEDETGDKITIRKEPSAAGALVMELIDSLIKRLPVDTNRIYITGLSMGGFGTFDLVARYPHRFAAALPVCGAGDPATAPAMAKVPMWIVTGAEDPAVSPEMTHRMFVALRAAGARPGYTEYPEVGHFSWIHAYSDELILQWLFRQRKTTR